MKKKPVIRFLQVLKIIYLFIWVGVSTLIYGIFCMLVSGFSEKAGRWISHLWCKHLAFFSGVKVITRGMEKLDPRKNYLFVANHISYYDIVVLFPALPYKLSFIARKNLFYIPIWGWGIGLTGHIPVDRSNPKNARKSIEQGCIAINKHKRSVVGFPEGTRSRTNEMAEFKLGLFSLALQAGIDIVPVAIHGTQEILRRGSVNVHSGTVYIDIADPISIQGYTQRDKNTIAKRVWNIIHDLVEKEKKKKEEG